MTKESDRHGELEHRGHRDQRKDHPWPFSYEDKVQGTASQRFPFGLFNQRELQERIPPRRQGQGPVPDANGGERKEQGGRVHRI